MAGTWRRTIAGDPLYERRSFMGKRHCDYCPIKVQERLLNFLKIGNTLLKYKKITLTGLSFLLLAGYCFHNNSKTAPPPPPKIVETNRIVPTTIEKTIKLIVLENIWRHIEDGLSPMEAALKGSKQIGFAYSPAFMGNWGCWSGAAKTYNDSSHTMIFLFSLSLLFIL